MKSLTQILREAYAGQPVNTADKKRIKVIGPNGKPMWKEVPAKSNITKEETELDEAGLWDNIHAKRERIKAKSGERMRSPGEKGAPTAQAFKAASVKEESDYDEWNDMTRSELKAAANAAKEILDMMDAGAVIERWQLSEITKASNGLTDVYINLAADNEYDEEDGEDYSEEEPA